MLTLCRDTLGSWWDQTWTKCSGQALKAYVSMLALWSMEMIDRDRLKWKVKEEKDHATHNKSSLTTLLSAFGSREGKTYPISTATKAHEISNVVKQLWYSLAKCCNTNLHMRLFFLTPFLIGSINDTKFLLTNQKLALIKLILYVAAKPSADNTLICKKLFTNSKLLNIIIIIIIMHL